MRVTRKLIEKFVDLSGVTDSELIEKLSLAGLEVDNYRPFAIGTNLCISYVENATPIPNTHLNLLQVHDGQKTRQVVCGAKNVAPGQNIVLARPGAKLAGGEIKVTQIYGYTSEGMACSYRELSVDPALISGEETEGIIVLSSAAPIGQDPIKYLRLDDAVFDFKIAPNRGDLLSVYGIAREISAVLRRPMNAFNWPTIESREKTPNNVNIGTNGCQQFTLRKISNIRVQPSPRWLVDILYLTGFHSVNNIVDISNYILLLFGQPLHMYDAKTIGTKTFTITDQDSGDFTDLFNNNHKVVKGDVLVKAGDDIGSLAGVIGGASTAISPKTVDIYLEAAVFMPEPLQKTMRRLNLNSEASLRFTRGIDHARVVGVSNFAALLVKQFCPDARLHTLVDEKWQESEPVPLRVNATDVNRKLGTQYTVTNLMDIARRLGLEARSDSQGALIVPGARHDITSPDDFIEEVIRLNGYDTLPSTLPTVIDPQAGLTSVQLKRDAIRNYLVSNGLTEVVTYTLTDEEGAKVNFVGADALPLKNPFGPEKRLLRRSVLPSLLDAVCYNVNRQQQDLFLFEVANLYGRGTEREVLGFIGHGRFGSKLSSHAVDYRFAKGFVMGILNLLGISDVSFEPLVEPFFHQGRAAQIMYGSHRLGIIGELSLAEANKRQLKRPVLFELDLTWLLKATAKVVPVTLPSTFPVIQRDVAVVLPLHISCERVIDVITIAGGELLKQAEIFDIYQGEGIPTQHQSIAVSMTFGSNARTLVEKEVAQVVVEITEALKAIGGNLRF